MNFWDWRLKMTRYHGINGVRVPFTAQEETDRDTEEAKDLNEKPMRDWKRNIRKTDFSMPRYLEDLITSNSLVMSTEMKKRYDEKIKVREERP